MDAATWLAEQSTAEPTWLDWVTAVGSVGTLLIGVPAVYLLVRRQLRSARVAVVDARLEQFTDQTGVLRLAITNAGPADAYDVDAEVQDRDGSRHRGITHVQQVAGDAEAAEPELPLAQLHAGAWYYVYGYRRVLGATPAQAALTWRDRRGVQTRVVPLSVHLI